jgi:hypothetical protein
MVFFLPHTTEGVALNGSLSVLIVDRSEETREVLQTALERRGVRTLTTGRTDAGLRLAQQHHPDLIVLDLELDDAPAEQFSNTSSPVPSEAADYRPRMVLLGNLRGWRDRLPEGEFVSKPYHYGPLVRKIEELLGKDTPAGSVDRADVVCYPRGRSRQPL